MSSYPISARWAFPPFLLLFASCAMAPYQDAQAQNVTIDVNAAQPPPMDQATLPPLDQLMAPVALYPDPLLSLMLPAATYPDQVQQASNFVQQGGSPSQISYMGWDSSVQGLAHYPAVLEWMGANPDWTVQLGGAFANQPDAVMDAVQDLRRRAQSAGTLVSNPQQRVIAYEGTVQIVPEQPQVVYVPQYDPAVVYVAQPPGFYSEPLFGWSEPYPAGVWMTFDFDWRNHGVYQGDWYDYHMQHGGWGHPVDYRQVQQSGGGGGHYQGWKAPRSAPPPPPQLRVSPSVGSASLQARFAQPGVISGAPRPPANAVRVNSLVTSRNEHPAGSSPANAQPRAGYEAGAGRPQAGNPGGSNVRSSTAPSEQRPLTPAERSMEPGAGRGPGADRPQRRTTPRQRAENPDSRGASQRVRQRAIPDLRRKQAGPPGTEAADPAARPNGAGRAAQYRAQTRNQPPDRRAKKPDSRRACSSPGARLRAAVRPSPGPGSPFVLRPPRASPGGAHLEARGRGAEAEGDSRPEGAAAKAEGQGAGHAAQIGRQ